MAGHAVNKTRPPASPGLQTLRRNRLARYGGPVLIALAAAAMLLWTWGTWPDILVDFGRELYMPWQITKGQVLYRDLAERQLRETGETLPGVEVQPERESFSIRFGRSPETGE